MEIPTTVYADGVKFRTGLSFEAIPSRGITEAVCRSHGYGMSVSQDGGIAQVANYRDSSGAIVGQKVKRAGKQFSVIGDLKKAGLWQQHRWRGGQRNLLITEGETDLLAWQSISGDRFPAVSIPNGAAGAANAIKAQIEYVESFERVVICFDNDEPGRKAAQEVADLLRPGKACLMQIPDGFKDICEVVAAKKGQMLVDAFWNASPRRPDGIVAGDDLLKALLTPPATGLDYPWKGLTAMLKGARRKELVTITAGTGVGKSLLAGLIGHGFIKQDCRLGYISLEESLTRTVERLVGAEIGRPLHVQRDGVTDEQLVNAWKQTFDGRVVVYNHFGSTDAESLLNRVRYMRIAEGVDFVIVDHLSILVSGWGDGDERRLIDNVMTHLRSICEQTGVGMILISHLRAPTGTDKSHEEGKRPQLSELRGSKSIGQLSDAVIAIQRDQMDEENSHVSSVWVLKNRHCGTIGLACKLRYDPETGLMTEEGDDVDCPF
ncbi:MAG: toprim domain-containing protein [Flavobacteriales bacterium]|nr:toprim domain-containing protein [Flavobacteriales bacterium]